MKNQLYYEKVIEKHGDVIVASKVHRATKKEIATAKHLYKNGKCSHSIIVDIMGWPYDLRSCAICGKSLGTV